MEAQSYKTRAAHRGPQLGFPEGHVEIDHRCLMIRDLEVSGSALDAARTCVAQGEDLEAVVREMLNLGGQMLLHGASQATVDSVSAEVDRLIDAVATATAEELPRSLDAPLQHLDAILAEHFDANRKDSVQQQLAEVLGAASAAQQRSVIATLLDDKGPLGLIKAELAGKLQLMVSRQDELLTKISAVSEQVVAGQRLKKEQERGTAQGIAYEEQLLDLIETTFRPFEDIVEPTGLQLGTDKNKCGDCVISLNPEQTRGKTLRIVVEAKDRAYAVHQALEELGKAMSNREAAVGIIVFSTTEHAPLRGHSLRVYPGNRLVAVFDPEQGDSLPLEVACELARGLAITGLDRTQPDLDSQAISKDLEHLTQVIDDARSIKRGLKAAYKGLDQADHGYEQLRREALAVVSDVTEKLR